MLTIWCSFCCSAQTSQNDSDSQIDSLQHKAEAGDREAQGELGNIAQGNHDYKEALKWFRLAADQGLADAQVGLGFLYDMGLGTEKNSDQAVYWYRLAAAQSNSEAEFDLGMCYLHGEGVEQDLTSARKWFSSALKHGDRGRSANGMGLTYEDSSPKNYAEAFGWYKKGAEMGFGEAQFNVCRMAAQGLGIATDYSGAMKWCSQLADTGDSWGEYGMGRIYENGIGVPPDPAKAFQWFLKSAEHGNPPGQYSVGVMYSDGKGVRRDLVKAYMWLAVAGSRKHPDAQVALETLTSNMNEQQISAGQALAQIWTKDHPPDPEKNFDHIIYEKE